MTRELKPGDKISCVIEQQLSNCMLVRFSNGKGGNKSKVFRGVLIDESCSATKRVVKGKDASSKPALTKEYAKRFIQNYNSPHVSGKFLRNKRRQNCLVLDDFYIDYHHTGTNHEDSDGKERQFESTKSNAPDLAIFEEPGLFKEDLFHKEIDKELAHLIPKDTVVVISNKGTTSIPNSKDLKFDNHSSRRKGKPKRCSKYKASEQDEASQDSTQTQGVIDTDIVMNKRCSKRDKASRPKRFFGSEFLMNLSAEKKPIRKKKPASDDNLMEYENAKMEEASGIEKQNEINNKKRLAQSKQTAKAPNEQSLINENCEDGAVGVRKSPRKAKKRSFKPEGESSKKLIVIDTKRKKLVKIDGGSSKEDYGVQNAMDDQFQVTLQNKEKTSNNIVDSERESEKQTDRNSSKSINDLNSEYSEQDGNNVVGCTSVSPLKSKGNFSANGQKVAPEEKSSKEVIAKEQVSHEMLICHEAPFDEMVNREEELLKKQRTRKQAERVLKGKIKVLESKDMAHLARLREIEMLKSLAAQGKKYVMLDLKETGVKESGAVNSGRKAMTIEVSALDLTKHNFYGKEVEGQGLFRMTLPSGVKAVMNKPKVNSNRGKPSNEGTPASKIAHEKSKIAHEKSKTAHEKSKTADASNKANAISQLALTRKVSVVPNDRSKQKGKKKLKEVADFNIPKIIIDKTKGIVRISGPAQESNDRGSSLLEAERSEALEPQKETGPSNDKTHLNRSHGIPNHSTGASHAGKMQMNEAEVPEILEKQDVMGEQMKEEGNPTNAEMAVSTAAVKQDGLEYSSDNGGSMQEKKDEVLQKNDCLQETCSENGELSDNEEDILMPQNELDCIQKLRSKYDDENVGTEEEGKTQRGDCNSITTAAYAQLSFQRLVASAHAEKLKAEIDMASVTATEAELNPEEEKESHEYSKEQETEKDEEECNLVPEIDNVEKKSEGSSQSGLGGSIFPENILRKDKVLVVALTNISQQRLPFRKNPFRDKIAQTLDEASSTDMLISTKVGGSVKASSINLENDSSSTKDAAKTFFEVQTGTLEQSPKQPISGIENIERRMKDLGKSTILPKTMCRKSNNNESSNTKKMEKTSNNFGLKDPLASGLTKEAVEQDSSEWTGCDKKQDDEPERESSEVMSFGKAFPSPFYAKVANENVTVKVLKFAGSKGKNGEDTPLDNCEQIQDLQNIEKEKDTSCERDSLGHGKCFCNRDEGKNWARTGDLKARPKSIWKCQRTGLRKYPTVNRSLRSRPTPASIKDLAKYTNDMGPSITDLEECKKETMSKKASAAREQGEELLKQMLKLNKGLFLKAETNQLCRKGDRTAR
ncbi:uncharacterized protein LOC135696407 [Rhopilema esculentum]|uniref:uncharacterized protein LOC135696407 n=1 Tax=Rhopilema esculentum TaxID=499914 RepID=UPI0031D281B0|eukprot:gene11910-2476_t